MNEEQLNALKGEFKNIVDVAIKENVEQIVGKEVAEKTASIVSKMRAERAAGNDVSGVSDETKIAFVKDIKNIGKLQD